MGRTGALRFASALCALASLLAASGALASGPGAEAPWYVDQFGGGPADLKAFYDGRTGIVMARAPRPMLYIDWRLLHGLKVGEAIGPALSVPCCDLSPKSPDTMSPPAVDAWREARKLVPGAPEQAGFFQLERSGPDYTSIQLCFPDAFDTAAATLRDRAARHGPASAEVRAWLAAQDAVFRACSETGVALPPMPAGAPVWLRADRAYQEAALALYAGDNLGAAERFAAIARDPRSPWRPLAPYLRVRALTRRALAEPTPDNFAAARAAIAELAQAPAGTYGQGRIRDLRRVLDFRDRPAALLAALDRQLNAPDAPADAAIAFRDYSALADKAAAKPQMIDWMATLAPRTAQSELDAITQPGDAGAEATLRLLKATRLAALAHAQARWRATRDQAWLVAALGLVDPGEGAAGPLVAEAERVAPASPAWIDLQHQIVRLGLQGADFARLRARLDAVLARDLSTSDRNVFTAERMQLAEDAPAFTRLALRRRLCAGDLYRNGCVRESWDSDDYQPTGVYDGVREKGSVGLGEDARAVLDRLPLAARMAIGANPGLPAKLRLDIDLTSYARAVALQDDAAIDILARRLAVLLPQLEPDWRRIPATPKGPAKRFAEFQILAKIPGLRFDLVDYVRPEGARPEDFQEYWIDWYLTARPAPGRSPPDLTGYQRGGEFWAADPPYALTDLACLGECQRAASPLRLPDFAARLQPQARRERGYFLASNPPKGAVSVWDETLAYVRAHSGDPRAPETLHWLVHVGRFGGGHDHLGRRAFTLLHQRYPTSAWAKRTPYYYD